MSENTPHTTRSVRKRAKRIAGLPRSAKLPSPEAARGIISLYNESQRPGLYPVQVRRGRRKTR